ncbi:MAG: PhoPQ-activated protein PqaA family protein [Bacteroidota bacterium]
MSVQFILHTGLLVFLFQCACFSQQPQKALEKYISNKDSAYKAEVVNIVTNQQGRLYEVSLVSQTWQKINWTHRLIIFFPENAKYSNTLLLVLRHIYDRNQALASLKVISDSTGTPSAILYDIPNQPLFNGKEEDDLQAYTFSRYINTGDETWPILFPMVKSVTRAIDAIQALAEKEERSTLSKFIVAGHSKRGHTSWLAAAVDSRIKGIIPMAIDVLNAPLQLPHHLKMFGKFSTPSKDATDFLSELKKPLGKSLIQMIDPYSYKDSLALPKLIVSASNDDYFPTDALNLYWDGLKGAKSILYLSDASHVRADSDPRINPTAFAFVRAIAIERTLPQLNWKWERSKQLLKLTINTDSTATRAVLWQASSQSKDFRESQWSSSSVKQIHNGSRRQFEIAVPGLGADNRLFYGEVEFEQNGHKFLLSTQIYRYSSN